MRKRIRDCKCSLIRGEQMKIKDGIIGLAVGDALGVPCEFHDREVF